MFETVLGLYLTCMPASLNLASRELTPEVMDDPSLDAALHRQALRGLARINAVSGSARLLWTAIERALANIEKRPIRVLDLACGGGDVTLALARLGVRRHVDIEVVGCDISPTALEHARAMADGSGLPVRFIQQDVLREPPPAGFDLCVSSLFLHHLQRDQAVRVMRCMAEAADGVLINDLRRSAGGLAAAQLGVRVLTRSPVVHVDGPRSVRAAFTQQEMREMAEEAGMHGAQVTRRFPFRMLLSWRRG